MGKEWGHDTYTYLINGCGLLSSYMIVCTSLYIHKIRHVMLSLSLQTCGLHKPHSIRLIFMLRGNNVLKTAVASVLSIAILAIVLQIKDYDKWGENDQLKNECQSA